MNTGHKCKFCGATGNGIYCSSCGIKFVSHRLTVKGMLHEVFHFFTHIDKGLPFTLKKLAFAPGTMQRTFVEGDRSRYQKPFSMFFICTTLAALALYWINGTVVKYFGVDNSGEVVFFHERWVLLQICMLPLYSFITWLVFKNNKYNYAEILVFQLYSSSFIFLMLVIIHLSKFIAPHFQTRYIELPAIIIYGLITNLNFFNRHSKWLVVVQTIVAITASYFLSTLVQDLLVKLFF